jgi:hypothetical protein
MQSLQLTTVEKYRKGQLAMDGAHEKLEQIGVQFFAAESTKDKGAGSRAVKRTEKHSFFHSALWHGGIVPATIKCHWLEK